jgi:hypothetical protein
MMARVEARQVLGEAVEVGASVEYANAKTTRTWDALVILCLFAHKWLAGSGEGPAGGAAISASDSHGVDRSYLDLGRVLSIIKAKRSGHPLPEKRTYNCSIEVRSNIL